LRIHFRRHPAGQADAYLEQAAHALANDGMLQRFQVLVYPDGSSPIAVIRIV